MTYPQMPQAKRGERQWLLKKAKEAVRAGAVANKPLAKMDGEELRKVIDSVIDGCSVNGKVVGPETMLKHRPALNTPSPKEARHV